MVGKKGAVLSIAAAIMLVSGGIAIRGFDGRRAEAAASSEYRFTFSEGENLSALELNGFVVEGGVLRRDTDLGGDAFVWLEEAASWRDVMMEFAYTPGGRLENNDGYVLSAILHKDPSAGDWQASDRVRLRNTGHIDARKLAVDVPVGRTIVNDNAGAFEGFVEGTTYRVKIVSAENRLQVTVDDVLQIDSCLSASRSGRIGLGSWQQGCEIDDLVIREATTDDLQTDEGVWTLANGGDARLAVEGDFSVTDAGTADAKLVRTTGSGDARVWLGGAYPNAVKYTFGYKVTGTADESKNYELALMTSNTDPASWQQGARVILRATDWMNRGAGEDSVGAYTGVNERKGGCITDFAGFEPNREYAVEAVFYGGKAQMSVDGVLVLDASVGAQSAGRLGINSWNTYCELSALTVAPATAVDLVAATVADSYEFDFEDAETAAREFELSGGFEICDGVLKRAAGTGDAFAWLKKANYADVLYEFDYKATGASAEAQNNDYGVTVIAGQDGLSDWQTSNRVIFHETTWADKTTAVEARSGFGEVEGKNTLGGFAGCEPNRTYRIKVLFMGTRAVAWVDGVKTVDATMPASREGRLGFDSWQAYCEIDNLIVRRATAADLPEEEFEPRDSYTFDFADGSEENRALRLDADWQIADGVLKRAAGNGDAQVWLQGNTAWRDAAVTFSLKFTGSADGDSGLSVILRKSAGGWQSSNFVTLRPLGWTSGGSLMTTGYVDVYNGLDTVENYDESLAPFAGFAVGETYAVKILNINNRVRVFVDDVLVADMVSRERMIGAIGLNSWNSYAEIDDMTVRTATVEEIESMPAAPAKQPEIGGGDGPEVIDPGTTDTPKNRNGALIVGLSVGGAALVVLGAAAGVIVAFKKKKEKGDE